MAKQTEFFPGVALMVHTGTGNFGINPISPYVNGSSSKDEQQIAAVTQKQLLIMHNQRLKSEVATSEISNLHKHGSKEFSHLAAQVTEINEQASGKGHEAVVQAFNKLNLEMAGNHILGAMSVGARTIAEPINKPIDLPVAEKKGWRILGG